MSEVRTTSSTGGQKGVKPERLSLLPRLGLESIARVFGFGAEKYDSHNWRKGYEWSKSLDALQRHVLAFQDGETYDAESGLPHLAHAGFHVLVLLTWLAEQGEGGEFDDRYKRPEPEDPFEDFVKMLEAPRVVHIPPASAGVPPIADLGRMWTLPDEGPEFGQVISTVSNEPQTMSFSIAEAPLSLIALMLGCEVDDLLPVRTFEAGEEGTVETTPIATRLLLQEYHNRG